MVDNRFPLDPGRRHLNLGAIGVAPHEVLAAKADYLRQANTNPIRFHQVDTIPLVERAREVAAGFLGSADVALVHNTTMAAATVLGAVRFVKGDEIVVSNHSYPAVTIAAGARARVRQISFPVTATDDEIVEAFARGVNENTKLVIVDAISSATALVLPVRGIVEAVGPVPVLVDAAHAPGHIDQLPADTGADFWVGNFHKWAYAARTVAGLYVAPRWRDTIRPLVPSFLHQEGFPRGFDHLGTMDYSAWMALPEAMSFWHSIGGWDAVAETARLLDKGVQVVADALGVAGQVSENHAPLMRLVALPDGWVTGEGDCLRFYDALSTRYGIEAVPKWFDGRGYLRLCATPANREEDYQALAEVLAGGSPLH